jgi:hypothetical protein
LEEEKRKDEEGGLQPGPSSVIFRYRRGNPRLSVRVNRKEYTVGFKVLLLLIISAAWAVSIEFPSLRLSHPNYPSPTEVRKVPDQLKRLDDEAKALVDAAKAFSMVRSAQSGDLPELNLRPLTEMIDRSTFGDTHPFPNLLPSHYKFPSTPALDRRKHGRVCGIRTSCRRRY